MHRVFVWCEGERTSLGPILAQRSLGDMPTPRTGTAEGVHGDDAAGGVAGQDDFGLWAGAVVAAEVL